MSHGIKRAYRTGKAKPRRRVRSESRLSDVNRRYDRAKRRRLKANLRKEIW